MFHSKDYHRGEGYYEESVWKTILDKSLTVLSVAVLFIVGGLMAFLMSAAMN